MSARLASLALAAALLALTGCPGEEPPETEGTGGTGGEAPCFVGAPDAEPAILSLKQVRFDGTVEELVEGGTVEVVRPIQGGRVIFVGARVTGMCPENVTLRGRLRAVADGRVIAEDRRTQIDLVDQGDGAAEPAWDRLAEVANVPVCPDFLGNQIEGTEWTLEVTVEDESGEREATTRVRVVPMCPESGGGDRAYCQCECAENYEFGKCEVEAAP